MYKVSTSTGLCLTCSEMYRATEFAEKLLRIAGELGVAVTIAVSDSDGKVIVTMSREAAKKEVH